MEYRLSLEIQKKLSQNKKRNKWLKILTVLGCIVVFCTTYALILPAITMQGVAYCGQEAHIHQEKCYEQKLICTLSEEQHTHTDTCFEKSKVLECQQEKVLVHQHEAACYITENILECELEESEEHLHADACYKEVTTVICGQDEIDGHVHEETCYLETDQNICGINEDVRHIHEVNCYENVMVCSMEEHEHTLACYSNPEADVESKTVWEKTIPDVLTGIWADDLLSVAKSQLGYMESTANYIVTEDGKAKGYTRYGDWYGDCYGDWCAMYVSFCLNYAQIPEDDIVREANCADWVQKLRDSYQFEESGAYIPEKGDLIFFDMSTVINGSDHVGIVVEINQEQSTIKTIEGNSSNKVQYCTYNLTDSKIMGYGKLPKAPEPIMMMSSAPTLVIEELKEYIVAASAGSVSVTEGVHLTDVTLEINIPVTVAMGKEFIYELPRGIQVSSGLVGTTQTIKVEGANAYTCEFIEQINGKQELKVVFDEDYLMSVGAGDIIGKLTFAAKLGSEYSDNGILSVDITDNVTLVIPLSEGGRAGGIREGRYGNYEFKYNNEKNAFTNNPIYAKYYNADSPLGLAGSFHIVAFDTASLNTHTNGNILAHTLRANSNFGTNNYSDELTYAVNYQKLNSTSASSTGHVLVVGSENKVTIGGNNDNIYINGVKVDKPYNIVQDMNSGSSPFIDLTSVNIEVAGISSRMADAKDGGVTTSFEDQNNRYIQLNNPDSVGVYNISASDLNSYANNPLRMQGFSKNEDGTLIINVDCTGVKTVNMPAALVVIDGVEQSTNEVTEFSNGKVIWNFVNATGATINTNRMTGMVIALGATVNIKQNLNGTVIAEFVNVQAESHRTDFTGQIEILSDDYEIPDKGHVGIRKVDSENISIYLPDARFTLKKWNGKLFEVVEENLVTDRQGLLVLNGLDYNTAYQLFETTAPAGYLLNTEPYEFYVAHVDTWKYVFNMPSGFEGEELKSKVIKNIKNEKLESFHLKIEKEWYIGDTKVTGMDGLVNIDLKQKVYADEARTILLMTKSYANALEIDSHQGWKLDIHNVPGQGIEHIGGVPQIVYYSYFVEEEPVRGYIASYENNEGITSGTIKIKNTSTETPEKTEISLEKEWYTFEGELMSPPENSSVIIRLYQTGYEGALFHHQIGDRKLYGEYVLNEDNDWKCTISDLTEYENITTADGIQTVYYKYEAREVDVLGYEDSYINNGIYEGTITVKNTLKEHPSQIVVKKIWKDSENNDIQKTGEIRVDLYRKAYGFIDEDNYNSMDFKGASLYKEDIIISSENDWTTTITNLPLHGWMLLDGVSEKVFYTYYVQEVQVEDYKVSYENNQGITGKEIGPDGTSDNVITITNKEYAPYSLPDTGGIGTKPFALSGCLMMAISFCIHIFNKKRREGKL